MTLATVVSVNCGQKTDSWGLRSERKTRKRRLTALRVFGSEREERWTVLRSDTGLGFPGGAVVKNLPASAGDTGSSPGPGRSHMPRSN